MPLFYTEYYKKRPAFLQGAIVYKVRNTPLIRIAAIQTGAI